MDPEVQKAIESGEWKEKTDPKSGKTFFYNPTTKKTCWDLALELKKEAKTHAAPAEAETKKQTSSSTDSTAAKKTVDDVLKEGEWVAKEDPSSGKEFYYNKSTKKTCWDLAKELGLEKHHPKTKEKEAASEPATKVEEPAKKGSTEAEPQAEDKAPEPVEEKAVEANAEEPAESKETATEPTPAVQEPSSATEPDKTTEESAHPDEKPSEPTKTHPKTVEDVLKEGEWVVKEDPSSGKMYYYNKSTKKTCWDLAKKLGLENKAEDEQPVQAKGKQEAAAETTTVAEWTEEAAEPSKTEGVNHEPAEATEPSTEEAVHQSNEVEPVKEEAAESEAKEEEPVAGGAPGDEARAEEQEGKAAEPVDVAKEEPTAVYVSATKEPEAVEPAKSEEEAKPTEPSQEEHDNQGEAEPVGAADAAEERQAPHGTADEGDLVFTPRAVEEKQGEDTPVGKEEKSAGDTDVNQQKEKEEEEDFYLDEEQQPQQTEDDAAATAALAELDHTDAPTQEELASFVQKLIATSLVPDGSLTALSQVSTETLLNMLGCERAPFLKDSIPASVTQEQALNPAYRTMSLLRRLNEEFRCQRNAVQDQHDDSLQSLRLNHKETLRMKEEEHDTELKTLREKYLQAVESRRPERPGRQGELYQPLTAVELEHMNDEIARLERRITERQKVISSSFEEDVDSPSKATAGDMNPTTAKRLITFWKSKYDSLCKQYEEHAENQFSVKLKLEEAQNLMGHSNKQLQMILDILRAKEQKERHHAESLQTAYLRQMAKLGKQPQEPTVKPSAVAGAALSHSRLMAVAQHGWDGIQDSPARNSNSTAIAGNETDTFTALAAKFPKAVQRSQELADKKRECYQLESTLSESFKKVEASTAHLEGLQTQYVQHVASIHNPSAGLLEEMVNLQSKCDAYDASLFHQAFRRNEKKLRSLKRIAQLAEQIERKHAQNREKEEELRRTVREKEVDLVRVQSKVAQGQSISVADFSGARIKDPQATIQMLRSRLSAVDHERRIWRTRLQSASSAELDVVSSLEKRLQHAPSSSS